MRKLGIIREIWRYPVKGMAGEKIDSCGLDEMGLTGDRRWAMRDLARDEIQSCKFRPHLLRCTARASPDGGDIPLVELPDGQTISAADPRIHQQLSLLVGHASRLEALHDNRDPDRFRRYKSGSIGWLDELKATFDREDGEPLPDLDALPQSVADFVSVPGTFFLVAPVHLVTTATLSHLAQLEPDADWDRRRFRPNLVIDTTHGHGLVEQDWVGQTLHFGDVSLDCVATTPRCGAITRPQRHFGANTQVLRTVVKHAEQNVGVYGRAVRCGELRVGDEVWMGQPIESAG